MGTNAPDLLVRLFAKQIVNDAYLGILGRQPDAKGLDGYARSLRKSLGLVGLLEDLAGSDEHWDKLISAHSDDIVGAVFEALLGRSPDPEALAAYSKSLSDSHDLTALLKEISSSKEHLKYCVQSQAVELADLLLSNPSPNPIIFKDFLGKLLSSDVIWNRSVAERSSELVEAMFQGVLGRDPDPEAMEAYAASLNNINQFAPLLSEISNSKERWTKSINAHAEELVTSLYTGFLGYTPEQEIIVSQASILRQTGSLAGLLNDLKKSDEIWTQSLTARAEHLITSFYQIFFGRDPEAEALKHYTAQLALEKDLSLVISSLVTSQEHKKYIERQSQSGQI